MEIKYFENGFVGKAVYDTNEAIKCFNAGMDVRQTDGDDFLWENEEHEDPSDNEIIGRIIHVINDYGMVYVGFKLEGQKVVDIDSTNLSCGFKDKQIIYFLFNGEIRTGKISSISLTSNKLMKDKAKDLNGEICRSLGKDLGYYTEGHIRRVVDDLVTMASGNCLYVWDEKSSCSRLLPLDKVFPTKEALVKDLLLNAK